MRRSRRLTNGERWELGLFLTMLVVGFLCLTAILNLNSVPKLFASAFKVHPGQQTVFRPNDPTIPYSSPGIEVTPLQLTTPELAMPMPTVAALSPAVPPSVSTHLPTTPHSIRLPSETEIKWFHGEKYRLVKTMKLRVTAYSPDERCCWPYPGTTTASGLSVKTNRGRLVAADTNLIPMHALVSVPGYSGGAAVPVLDRGGAIKGHRLDVLMPTFDQAKAWGTKLIDVKVYVPVDE
jgi:3D (Asp-Asp-Asp) domain-containing protein